MRETTVQPLYASCEKHGPFIQALFDQKIQNYRYTSGCPTCILENRFARLNLTIPHRFRNATFESFQTPTEAHLHAKNLVWRFFATFLKNPRSGICAFLFGLPGTGKTHLAYAMVNESWKRKLSAAVVPVYELISKVRDGWTSSEFSAEDMVNSFVNLDLLIIDEIGVQAGSENEQEILFRVINRRYEEMKSTVLISNLSLEDTSEVIGQRSFERIAGEGGINVPFQWQTQRF